jgi:hypothetical protein
VTKKLPAVLALALLLGALSFVFRYSKGQEGDPDRYFHMALSRITADSGQLYLRSLPQVEDLGWGDYFLDKEFFFHQLTTLGYRISGDHGVERAAFFCSLLSLAVFFLFAAARLPWPLAFSATLLVFSYPLFAYRLTMLRPQVLAIATFLLMNVAILYKRPRLAGLATFFFTLSYHAFYVPLICLVWLGALSFFEDKKGAKLWRETALLGAFGCVAGLLANPYFPGNVVMAVIHARIPGLMKGELAGLNFGDELVPLRSNDFLELFYGPLLLILAAVFLLGYEFKGKGKTSDKRYVPTIYLLGVCFFFLFLSFQVLRAVEYLVPAAGLLMVLVLERLQKRKEAAAVLLGLLAVPQIWGYAKILRQQRDPIARYRVDETFKAIGSIPGGSAKVYNCEWDRTPYILYTRPDLRFVDILDPSFLYFSNYGAFMGREGMKRGTTADIHGLIRNAFHADYVFCGDQNITAQLRDDPGFQQIYPQTVNAGQSPLVPNVFRVRKEKPGAYVRSFDLAPAEMVDVSQLAAIQPAMPERKLTRVNLEQSNFLNLALRFKEEVSKVTQNDLGKSECVFVKPSAAEQRRLAGARYLGLGGGQGFKVWRNGRPLFFTRAGFPVAKSAQVLVPLDGTLKASDSLDILVCTALGGPYWGVTLSFWSESELAKTCAWKSKGTRSSPEEGWEYKGLQRLSCIGSLAGAVVPADIR